MFLYNTLIYHRYVYMLLLKHSTFLLLYKYMRYIFLLSTLKKIIIEIFFPPANEAGGNVQKLIIIAKNTSTSDYFSN
jgi:hypothetical protein